jgi:hypothetical protein
VVWRAQSVSSRSLVAHSLMYGPVQLRPLVGAPLTNEQVARCSLRLPTRGRRPQLTTSPRGMLPKPLPIAIVVVLKTHGPARWRRRS